MRCVFCNRRMKPDSPADKGTVRGYCPYCGAYGTWAIRNEPSFLARVKDRLVHRSKVKSMEK